MLEFWRAGGKRQAGSCSVGADDAVPGLDVETLHPVLDGSPGDAQLLSGPGLVAAAFSRASISS